MFHEETEDLTTIGSLAALIVTEHFLSNADKNNWIQEDFNVVSYEEQMLLSDTKSCDLCDNGNEQSKFKDDDCITSINICIQWALEDDKFTTALYELRDSAVILQMVCRKSNSKFKISLKMFKMQIHIAHLLVNSSNSKNTILELMMQN